MARVVLTTRANYFHWLDPEWTRGNLLSLFDWERDALQAVQAWHGFLVWGRPGAALMDSMTPAAVQLVSHLEELGGEREHFGVFIARAAFARPDDPLTKEWFLEFLRAANDDDRARFAWEADRLLEGLRAEQQSEIWNSWLRRYLEHRGDHPPAPQEQEFKALLGWAFRLRTQLEQLIECLEELPGEGGGDDHLRWRLEQGEPEGSSPDLLARLVLVMLRRAEDVDPWALSSLRGVITRLKREGAEAGLVRELIEKYVEHGGEDYHELLGVKG